MRKESILTRDQRDWLQTNADETGDNARKTRKRIRRRVRDGLLDFELLANNLPEKDVDQVLEIDRDAWQQAQDHAPGFERRPAATALRHVVAWLFRAIGNPHYLARDIEDAIQHYYRSELGRDAHVEVDINIEPGASVDEIRARVDEDGARELSRSELRTLYEADEVDMVEFNELLAERRESREDDLQGRRTRRGED